MHSECIPSTRNVIQCPQPLTKKFDDEAVKLEENAELATEEDEKGRLGFHS